MAWWDLPSGCLRRSSQASGGLIGNPYAEVEPFPIAHIWAELCFSFPLLPPNSCLLRYLWCPLANILYSVSERTAPHPILDQFPAFLRSHFHSRPHPAFYILGARLVWMCGDYLVTNFPPKCPNSFPLSPNLDFFHLTIGKTSSKPNAILV